VEPDNLDFRLEHVQRNVRDLISVHKRRKMFSVMKYAAGLLLILGAGSILYLLNHNVKRFPVFAAGSGSLQKGRIILADGSYHEFETKQTVIQQTSSGTVMLNNDTIESGPGSRKSAPDQVNRIIIPYGKRSSITLADGSRIWLNSGSQLSYPSEFKNNAREVYLSGEAFFDVAPDAGRPFIVITKEVRIRVLGTRFNVTSYPEDNVSQTVLLKGKVRVSENAVFPKSMELQPGERFTYDKSMKSLARDNVDAEMYSSWVDGFLIFNNEPTPEIFKKLERYYNRQIIADPALGEITFSGKLDLKDDISDVLNNIAFASSLHISRNGAYFIIKP